MKSRTQIARCPNAGSIRRVCILLLALAVSVGMVWGCGGRRSAQYTQQGNTYLRLKKVAEAQEAYKKAVEVDPENKEAKLGLARCYAIEKKYDEALAGYRELTDADPSFGEAYLEAVKILLAQAGAPAETADNYTPEIASRVEEFVSKFEKANPEQGGMLRAFVLRQTGRIDEAIALLTQLRDQFPNSAMARVGLASAYLAANKPDEAEQELKAVLDTIEPDSVAARMTLIDVYRTQGKLPEIVEQLQQLVAQRPDDAGLKLALARSLLDSGRIDEAEAAARPVLTANPDSGWANYVVGCCLLEKGVYDEAVECLETAAHALPQEPGVINMLARARSGGELPAEGEKAAAATTTTAGQEPAAQPGAPSPGTEPGVTEPGAPLTWHDLWRSARLRQLLDERDRFLKEEAPNLRESLVIAALLTGAPPLAEELAEGLPEDAPLRRFVNGFRDKNAEALSEALEQWKETDPEREVIRLNAEGFAFALTGARARALRTLSECLQKWPDNGVALRNLAEVYRAAQMPQFAAGCLQKLIATYRDNMEARGLLFRILLGAELTEQAQQAAELTYSLFPNDPVALGDLAHVYRVTGKSDLAVKVLERGVEALPDNAELRLRLAEAHLYANDAKSALATIDGVAVPAALGAQAASVAAFAAARMDDWAGVNTRCQSVDEKGRTLPLRLLQTASLVKTERMEEASGAIVETDADVAFGGREARILLLAFKKSVQEPEEEETLLAGMLAEQPTALGDYAYASACREMGFYSTAIEVYRRLNDTLPGQSALVGPLFSCLSRSGGTADRATVARELAAANSGMTVAWLGLAEVLKATSDTAGEREALDKALEAGADNAAVWRQRAEFFDRQGDSEAVLTAYRRLAELKPDDPSVANNLAYCILRDNGDASEALKWATQAVERLPNNPHVLHTAGLAELRTGSVEASLKHLSLALLIRPGDPTILLDYGQALIQSGREQEGKAHIKLALQYTDQLDLDFPRRAEAEKIVGSGSGQEV